MANNGLVCGSVWSLFCGVTWLSADWNAFDFLNERRECSRGASIQFSLPFDWHQGPDYITNKNKDKHNCNIGLCRKGPSLLNAFLKYK